MGTRQFESRLLDLVGRLVSHDYLWIVRYASADETHVFETRLIDQEIVEDYNRLFQFDDPFGRYWRSSRVPGVVVSRQAMDDSAACRRYQREFQRRADISDESGILLPLPGGAALGLFVESRTRFLNRQLETLNAIAPMIEGLGYAHVAGLLAGRDDADDTAVDLIRPNLILDRSGAVVHKSAAWEEAEGLAPDLRDVLRGLVPGQTGAIRGERYALTIDGLDDAFTVAPGGSILTLNWRDDPALAIPAECPPAAERPLLTRLEQNVLHLILQTKSSGEIAGELKISKTTVKKYKIRLYRKFGVNSERQLLSRLRRHQDV
ncbi:LuxR C-terminal-related transcriptional regulator [Methylopila musalis]|uniref:LuxR C-terminal-related transcriptional regulator n=1 Tax=Methylopila musalis TaxID=1134781 RepID=A0ABW3ZBP3_9HYPH